MSNLSMNDSLEMECRLKVVQVNDMGKILLFRAIT